MQQVINDVRTKLLPSAEDVLLRGDYGTALYKAWIAYTISSKFVSDTETARVSKDLARLVNGLIEADFPAIAEQKELVITPENRADLLWRHSPHYVRFRGLLAQPIPEIPLRHENKLPNNYILYKILTNLNNKFEN